MSSLEYFEKNASGAAVDHGGEVWHASQIWVVGLGPFLVVSHQTSSNAFIGVWCARWTFSGIFWSAGGDGFFWVLGMHASGVRCMGLSKVSQRSALAIFLSSITTLDYCKRKTRSTIPPPNFLQLSLENDGFHVYVNLHSCIHGVSFWRLVSFHCLRFRCVANIDNDQSANISFLSHLPLLNCWVQQKTSYITSI